MFQHFLLGLDLLYAAAEWLPRRLDEVLILPMWTATLCAVTYLTEINPTFLLYSILPSLRCFLFVTQAATNQICDEFEETYRSLDFSCYKKSNNGTGITLVLLFSYLCTRNKWIVTGALPWDQQKVLSKFSHRPNRNKKKENK